MKFARRFCKLTVTLAAFIYALCLYNGDPFLEYTTTDESVILSVIGQELEISTEAANTIKETYIKAEAQAGKWLPEKIKTTVRRIYSLLCP